MIEDIRISAPRAAALDNEEAKAAFKRFECPSRPIQSD
jgi:hypothetical protein